MQVENITSFQANQSGNVTCTNHMCIPDEDYIDQIKAHVFPTLLEWIFVLLYLLLFLVGLAGNALVCYAVWHNPHMRTVTNVFIVNLAVADFLVILVCLPPTLLADITETWYVTGTVGKVLCKIVLFLQTISVTVSVLTLSAISLERWYAICHPLKFKSTLKRAQIIIVIIWIIAVASAMPELVIIDLFRSVPRHFTDLLTYCSMSWRPEQQKIYQVFQMTAFYFLPLALMGFCYSRIALCLWKNVIPGSTERHKMTKDGKSNANAQLLSRRKAAKMLIAIVVMFALCFLPVYTYNILKYAGVLHQADEEYIPIFALVSHWLCYLNSSVNPIMYNFMSAKFRKEFQTSCFCCYRISRAQRISSGETTTNYKYTTQLSQVSQTDQMTLSTCTMATRT